MRLLGPPTGGGVSGEVGTDVQPTSFSRLLWIAVPASIAMVILRLGRVGLLRDGSVRTTRSTSTWWASSGCGSFQHPGGQREINELPRARQPPGSPHDDLRGCDSRPHTFPAFRIKADVIPGRYVTAWFEATKVGTYHLFCAEYCGTQHSGMVGRVVVMEPPEYQAWLGGGTGEGSMASAGEKLFRDLGCITCHQETGQGRGPTLQGLFGRQVALQSGQDRDGRRRVHPRVDFQPCDEGRGRFMPIMPTFQGSFPRSRCSSSSSTSGRSRCSRWRRSLLRPPRSRAPVKLPPR